MAPTSCLTDSFTLVFKWPILVPMAIELRLESGAGRAAHTLCLIKDGRAEKARSRARHQLPSRTLVD